MTIDVTMSDGTCVNVRASGGYSPDVMHDLMNRAASLMYHATKLVMPMTADDEEEEGSE